MRPWNLLDRIAGVLLLLAAILAAVWLAIPSTMFVKLDAVRLEGSEVTLVRRVPYGDVTVKVWSEITIDRLGGYEYGSGYNYAIIQSQPGDAVLREILHWAKPCLDRGPPLVFRINMQVMLLGLIPLRQTSITTLVEAPVK